MYFYLLFVAIYQVLTARYDRILFLRVYLSYTMIFAILQFFSDAMQHSVLALSTILLVKVLRHLVTTVVFFKL
jgi:hypothetical protein